MRLTVRLGLVFSAWLTTAVMARAEELTVTTYYPSPRGVYQELRTTEDTFLATQGGSVGIGTTNPDSKFKVDVSAGTTNGGGLRITGSNNEVGLQLENTNGGNPWVIHSTSSTSTAAGGSNAGPGALAFGRTHGSYDVVFSNSGNVGVGTASPGQKLHIVGGEAHADDFCLNADPSLCLEEAIILPGVNVAHVTGASPGCPAGTGGFLTRNWSSKSCVIGPNPACGCTTPAGWASGVPTCEGVESDAGGICLVSTPFTCYADSWTGAVCMGN